MLPETASGQGPAELPVQPVLQPRGHRQTRRLLPMRHRRVRRLSPTYRWLHQSVSPEVA
ncbi:hypothetical protein [Mycolicibacterium phocaicum]|uniref:hypothetical protein n=1 Tax=Mycolicibacterium phocaicum TaxID=319706 RepID=UPI001CFBC9F3|nr:hypothetical protein [Mycolicibacterium phocaicum]UCZ61053.1 hypothetical protein LHJ73_02095 [Mycolicibacterium phocaicum]